MPITPEGITGGLVSPDGKYVVRANDAGMNAVYPIDGGTPRTIPNLDTGFIPIQWARDGSSIYGSRQSELPTKVYKVNLVRGGQTLVQALEPESTTGVVSMAPVVATQDGSRFAYSYYQVLSVLYVISGLR